ncbi:glutamate-cysteine ligase catalytic subunit [Cristinia sonorae]|uniref:Glutamate--cysteine ligase n=1 Tax=Cristinia sonorae TaxID=1940300 RepID=A0A8K0V222_9AGAR|nr:glutamate-cysteine ligase catalytic subunit [Cristinia sonorae]
MGLLYLGTPLAWDDAKQYADHVRTHGITQFLHIWNNLKDRAGDELLWGDEVFINFCGDIFKLIKLFDITKVEYMVVAFDNVEKNAKLSLRQTEILAKLQSIVNDIASDKGDKESVPTFHPEYGRFMLESTPGSPYTGAVRDLLSVEENMRYRRYLARKYLKPNEVPLTMTSYPRLGVQGVFTEPHFDPKDAVSSHSLFVPEEITNPHARFPTLTANIRRRRGSKVAINLPIFVDDRTPRPFVDPTIPWQRNIYPEDPEAKHGAALNDHIYMDAMGFGMGCSCLQLTFQSCNVTHARRLYDALVPVAPIMLALTAASPLWRGYIADVDCRWDVVAASVDDRTEEERGLKPLKHDRFRIPKSRYGSVSLYISDEWQNRPEYNDIDAPYDAAIFNRLLGSGIDAPLAKHISHLFIRDPIVIFSETIHQDDTASNDHFENIQSTNWQTVRFKPPPVKSPIGWRVEFRSMEVQPTDYENAAFAVFVVLLSRAILNYKMNLYIPISKVDENMARAQRRDAVNTEKFFFRKDIFPPGVPSPLSTPNSSGFNSPVDPTGNSIPRPKSKKLGNCFEPAPKPEVEHAFGPVEEEYGEYTLDEIFNGKGGAFPGLIQLIYAYLETIDVDEDERRKIDGYMDLVKRRASGALQTPATWTRNFVRSHPAYKFDSVISQEINYDLMVAVDEIERGVRPPPEFLPESYNVCRSTQHHSMTNGI